jgi:hypothetical protein
LQHKLQEPRDKFARDLAKLQNTNKTLDLLEILIKVMKLFRKIVPEDPDLNSISLHQFIKGHEGEEFTRELSSFALTITEIGR